MYYIEKIVNKISLYFNFGAGIAIVGMTFIVTGNVILGFIGHSIFGAYEMASILTAFIISFALAYCSLQGGHVSVSFVMDRFPQKIQKAVGIITGIISMTTSFLLAWRCSVYAAGMWCNGETSGTLHLPLYPIVYSISFSLLLLGLSFLIEVGHLFKLGVAEKSSERLGDEI